MEAATWVEKLLLQHGGDDAIGCNTLGDENASCSYAALPEKVQHIGDELQRAGLRPGDQVALDCENSLASLTLMLTLVWRRHSVTLLPGIGQVPAPAFCRVRLHGAQAPSGCIPVLSTNPDWNGADGGTHLRLYARTSGTTGAAKLATHRLDTLRDNALNCVRRFALSPADRVVIPVAQAHMFGLGAGLLPALLAGASVELQAKANVLSFFAREKVFHPTVAYLTPSFCQALVRARRAPRPYRLTVTAGDRIGEGTFRDYERSHGTLACLYGSTELGAIAAGSPDLPQTVRAVTVGLPMAGVQVETSGEGDTGELVVRHTSAFEGYADARGIPRPSTDGAAHRTADLGRVRADGTIQVLGRLDHRVKRDGRMVAYTDVETALESLPMLARAIVFADHSRPPGPRGSVLVACCEPLPQHGDLDPRALRRASLEVLDGHAVPDEFVWISNWPTLPSGKVDRSALLASYQAMHPNQR